MPAAFSRTLHAIDKDRVRVRGLFLLMTAIVLAWACWLGMAKVAVYHSTMRARIEVQTAAHAVASEVTGRVIESHLKVGAQVNVCDVLVLLDATTEKQACAEARVRRQTNLDSCAAIAAEVEAEEAAIVLAKAARTAAMAESVSRTNEAEIRNAFAGLEEGMLSTLRNQRAASELEYQRAAAELKAKAASVVSLHASETKLDQDWALESQEREVRVAKLRREVAGLAGAARLEEVTIAKLEHAISQRVIRAPISGNLGDVAEVRVGSVLSPAQRLGTVIPNDTLRAVAFFPTQSVGLLKIGQPAVIRLDGFPWMQFGSVPAVVENVGNEASSGVIRVELVLQPANDCPIPLAHGLPGSLQVQVERVSPATLILRAAGQYLAPRKKPTLVAENSALSQQAVDSSQTTGSSTSSASRREQP